MPSSRCSPLRRPLSRSHDEGIAIGPILFVVALMGLLVAAIAASSGSFGGSNSTDAARTKASALIQIGSLLKAGFERIISAEINFDSITIDPAATTDATDFFSPSGGGVTIPSIIFANDPSIDIWRYPFAAIPQMGSAATERVAMLKVPLNVCDQVNLKSNSIGTSAAEAAMTGDIGDVTVATLSGGADWPAPLLGKEAGCLKNSNGATPGYFYYQVLGSR